jgi:3-deoxy-7-phosphoheptulonate synthase
MNEFAKKRTWGPTFKYERVEAYTPIKKNFVKILGPCSVENDVQIHAIAKHASVYATHLRGGVFRAGTNFNPNFGWVRKELIASYHYAAKKNRLENIIEVLDYRDMDWLDQYADCYQVGCRQMQNYTLLKEVGLSGKPVFLKRGQGTTIDEFLCSADQVLANGCKEIYLIERGSSTNATHVRWDLSISMIPAIKALTKMPILVDGSHGTGRRDLVEPMTLAGIAAGADGCLVEFHNDPDKSISDSDQALSFKELDSLMFKIEEYIKLRRHLNELSSVLL